MTSVPGLALPKRTSLFVIVGTHDDDPEMHAAQTVFDHVETTATSVNMVVKGLAHGAFGPPPNAATTSAYYQETRDSSGGFVPVYVPQLLRWLMRGDNSIAKRKTLFNVDSAWPTASDGPGSTTQLVRPQVRLPIHTTAPPLLPAPDTEQVIYSPLAGDPLAGIAVAGPTNSCITSLQAGTLLSLTSSDPDVEVPTCAPEPGADTLLVSTPQVSKTGHAVRVDWDGFDCGGTTAALRVDLGGGWRAFVRRTSLLKSCSSPWTSRWRWIGLETSRIRNGSPTSLICPGRPCSRIW